MKFPLLALLVLAGCSKSNDLDRKEDIEKQIVDKKYAVTSLTGKHGDGTLIPESRNSIPDYEKDDYFFFKSDHTWTGNNNVQKEPGHPEELYDYGSWTLINEEYLQLTGTVPMAVNAGNPAAYWPLKITEVTETTVKWESTDPLGGGDIYWGVFTVLP